MAAVDPASGLFDLLDRNRDGVISRSEFGAAFGGGGAAAAAAAPSRPQAASPQDAAAAAAAQAAGAEAPPEGVASGQPCGQQVFEYLVDAPPGTYMMPPVSYEYMLDASGSYLIVPPVGGMDYGGPFMVDPSGAPVDFGGGYFMPPGEIVEPGPTVFVDSFEGLELTAPPVTTAVRYAPPAPARYWQPPPPGATGPSVTDAQPMPIPQGMPMPADVPMIREPIAVPAGGLPPPMPFIPMPMPMAPEMVQPRPAGSDENLKPIVLSNTQEIRALSSTMQQILNKLNQPQNQNHDMKALTAMLRELLASSTAAPQVTTVAVPGASAYPAPRPQGTSETAKLLERLTDLVEGLNKPGPVQERIIPVPKVTTVEIPVPQPAYPQQRGASAVVPQHPVPPQVRTVDRIVPVPQVQQPLPKPAAPMPPLQMNTMERIVPVPQVQGLRPPPPPPQPQVLTTNMPPTAALSSSRSSQAPRPAPVPVPPLQTATVQMAARPAAVPVPAAQPMLQPPVVSTVQMRPQAAPPATFVMPGSPALTTRPPTIVQRR
mmetsp:Transcript_26392/g.61467  ORF Transcript_26392/g.61467 Transcript_26392/m.61467 type:complete len:543 (+) Transcript_26392:134-1762(+)|eukprot:CAMPEP_0178431186 /NCGR_PEP_ID=MMETSP0689_2-20121128/31712_1 /TAXON_ID=160604 /ORGANISM="Amphidinium massartii, Strain CS-259" /LENGTH=542 /DNA_ID=CAMNT_0020053079 /DNA_START=56 /DNA_END=1684 /DNA_ORIENTATION=+